MARGSTAQTGLARRQPDPGSDVRLAHTANSYRCPRSGRPRKAETFGQRALPDTASHPLEQMACQPQGGAQEDEEEPVGVAGTTSPTEPSTTTRAPTQRVSRLPRNQMPPSMRIATPMAEVMIPALPPSATRSVSRLHPRPARVPSTSPAPPCRGASGGCRRAG